jgi:hypothetical protein
MLSPPNAIVTGRLVVEDGRSVPTSCLPSVTGMRRR